MVLAVAAVTVLAAGLYVLRTYNPLEVSFYPKCPTKLLFDVDCPGCGTARGLHALLNGRVALAWHYNPALFVLLPLLAFLGVAHFMPRGSAMQRAANWRWLPLIVLVAIVVWTIVRNVWLRL